ncbi:iron ABC transporter substrate-binding protein [Williamsia sp. CHRR-6]|uniref:iron ABC transporter substrate-binding protein n=1 Tax=Williamsia sp. CHRR-6 TaxID=2835871 RepID=UPI001BDA9F03|nr:iron ABC transporter substrate-binding protein [Williamsia sp. CHRR-6]MBT0567451.1 iron ABC transporter substrate-binding protein [Williamsia sp. CHRR-6]
MSFHRRLTVAVTTALLLSGVTACGSASSGEEGRSASSAGSELVIYSGRDEDLVDPLIDRIGAGVGVRVEVDYSGNTNAQAAKILEEGDRSPADVFLGQDAGALGALDDAGVLATLPQDILDRVPERYRSANGTWVATSARARVLAYNTDDVQATDLPTGIDGILDPRWKGKIGYAPTNASFQAFVTGLRVARGEDGAEKWLRAFSANEPVAFEGNGPLISAVDDGQVAAGLTNHYYFYPYIAEKGATASLALHSFAANDPGSLVNVAGVGVLASADNTEQAFALVREMLSAQSQQYFADETAEYPVVAGVTSKFDLPPLPSGASDLDLGQLASLEQTQALLTKVGMI